MSVRLLHLADLHLGYRPGRLGDRAGDRSAEFTAAFRRAIDFALADEQQIDAVLIVGDLFERHRPEQSDIELVRNEFQRLDAAGKPVILTPGTHDGLQYPNCVYREESFPGMELIDTPNIGKPLTFHLNGEQVHFYGLAYQPGRSKPPLDVFQAADVAGRHVTLIHGSLMHNPQWETYTKDVPLQLERLLESGMDYIALGHYHSFQEHGNGQPTVVYCGSLERKSVREQAERLLVVAELDDNGAHVRKSVYPARAVLSESLDLSPLEDCSLETMVEEIRRKAPEGAILDLRLEGSAEEPIDLESMRKQLMPKYLFYLNIDDQTLLWQSGRLEQWAAEPTVRGRFTRRMMEKIRQAPPEDAPTLNLALKLALVEFMRDDQENTI